MSFSDTSKYLVSSKQYIGRSTCSALSNNRSFLLQRSNCVGNESEWRSTFYEHVTVTFTKTRTSVLPTANRIKYIQAMVEYQTLPTANRITYTQAMVEHQIQSVSVIATALKSFVNLELLPQWATLLRNTITVR